MTRKKDNLFDKTICLRNANEFYNLAKDINSQREFGEYKFLIPFVVNLSFACELFMKYLLGRKTVKRENGHNLKSLFALLPEGDRIKIRIAYDGLGIRTLEQSLDICSTYFNDFRYIHEKNDDWKIYSSDLFKIAHALYNVCNK